MESVCSYTLHDDNDPTISVESSLEDGDFVYFTLPTDRRYSPFFEVSNAAGTWNRPGTYFSEIHVHVYMLRTNLKPAGGFKASRPVSKRDPGLF